MLLGKRFIMAVTLVSYVLRNYPNQYLIVMDGLVELSFSLGVNVSMLTAPSINDTGRQTDKRSLKWELHCIHSKYHQEIAEYVPLNCFSQAHHITK